ncbi:hypothetical protein AAFN85_03265 [Mucilaginibacter sp. CAU 1740]|uniref:hypothetical protein n=1 Tax=Mucilaginibacter sp. CAU 1740 TaxID=3140365 RepID=UPI00325B2CB6
MKKFFLILGAGLFLAGKMQAQVPLQDSLLRMVKFKAYQIVEKRDTTRFYVYQTSPRPRHMLLFLDGSVPKPLFNYEYEKGQLKVYTWNHGEQHWLPEDYLYVLIARPGYAGVLSNAQIDSLNRHMPAVYLEKNSLDYRVRTADAVINYCRKKLLKDEGKTIVFGHSEGFNVVSRLLTVNKKITHGGLWCGSAMPDYYDFMIMKRRELYEGKVSDTLAARQLDTMLNNYREIFKDPGYAKPGSIYTNKRWISYARGPIEDLKQVAIPLYQIIATQDSNAPYESAFIVPLEFIRLGKTNLTLRTLIGGDHSLNTTSTEGKKVSHWKECFLDFISWSEYLIRHK